MYDSSFLEFKKHEVDNITISPFEMNIDTDIIHHKNEATLSTYKWVFNQFGTPKTIFEIGVKNGGSLYLFNLISKETKIVGIDISIEQIPEITRKKLIEKNILFFACDSLKTNDVDEIVNANFDSIDMIIDDGAHTIDTITTSFKHLWSKVSKNGLYIIEDWSALHPQHRLELFDFLMTFLVQDWTSVDISSDFPFMIHIHRNLIIINKRQ